MAACSKDNNDNKLNIPSPKEQWSKTIKGNGELVNLFVWDSEKMNIDREPIDHVTNPEKQLAHKALKEYGPFGEKISTEQLLALSKIE